MLLNRSCPRAVRSMAANQQRRMRPLGKRINAQYGANFMFEARSVPATRVSVINSTRSPRSTASSEAHLRRFVAANPLTSAARRVSSLGDSNPVTISDDIGFDRLVRLYHLAGAEVPSHLHAGEIMAVDH